MDVILVKIMKFGLQIICNCGHYPKDHTENYLLPIYFILKIAAHHLLNSFLSVEFLKMILDCYRLAVFTDFETHFQGKKYNSTAPWYPPSSVLKISSEGNSLKKLHGTEAKPHTSESPLTAT